MSLSDWITLAIAVYGAGLSTWIYFRKQRRSVKVSCEFGHSHNWIPERFDWSMISLRVHAVNDAQRQIQIESAGLIGRNGEEHTNADRVAHGRQHASWPVTLSEGESLSAIFFMQRLHQYKHLDFVEVFVEDSLGERYSTKIPAKVKKLSGLTPSQDNEE